MTDAPLISVQDHGRVRELSLSRPPVNALDPGLMQALRSALREACQAGCQGIVISGRPGCFSAGLDVPALLRLDRAGMRLAWEALFSLLAEVAMSEVPIAAALTGHSPAGGAVVSICADYRVLAEGPYLMGLNEVEVGLPVPDVVYRVLSHVVGERTAERLAVTGALLSPAEALRCGLVDELAPLAEVVPRAVGWLQGVLGRAPAAVAATRRLARQPLFDAFAVVDGTLIEKMLEAWFSPETQAAAQALVARLGRERRRDPVAP
jgi:enoyl-CoA hydratase/carnithine racemase